MSTVEGVFSEILHAYAHSQSYRLFTHMVDQLSALMRSATAGLHKDPRQPGKIVRALRKAKNNGPSTTPLKDKNEIGFTEFTERLQSDVGLRATQMRDVAISFDEEETERLIMVLEKAQDDHDRLPFYLNSVLLIALWSSFEAYLQGVLAQVFVDNPSELASDKMVTVRELLAQTGSVVEFLIEREVSNFGHQSLDGMIKDIRTRLKFDFQQTEKELLQELYLLRNIAAHSAGFIRASQRTLIPSSIAVYENQIEISLDYLQRAITQVGAIVRRMDKYLVERWQLPKSEFGKFDDDGRSNERGALVQNDRE